ncbi:MAG: bifunctional phosphoribosyl-AMP cyclohydrolase/phosphoribosyl-ATP diphosphatase HisIE [Bacteroidales bacterium]|nr:bifunctional phosphoribosyl-AMP cyclohydrolase/phosphoribosyl-ATP diphosphatase HisIE [Bacteroidales bacterium]MCB9013769.1 bifunctional phosphoribosyl-AMP cyclohydrolase/phosphoribosyl-ATP diphosphatase HisIE [Bacteroidales bacterium]
MKLDFEKNMGLIPAVIQDVKTNKVLMLGFMNEEAYMKSKDTGLVTFYSRTRKRLWTKGEESGNFLRIQEIIPDCDNDTLLIKAEPTGPVCHTGADTCFNENNSDNVSFLLELQDLIHKRKQDMPPDSYTTKLFQKGMNKIAQKVGEEAVELVIEAMDINDDLLLNEAADLMYHLLVLLSARDKDIRDVVSVLVERHRKE